MMLDGTVSCEFVTRGGAPTFHLARADHRSLAATRPRAQRGRVVDSLPQLTPTLRLWLSLSSQQSGRHSPLQLLRKH
eukprot:6188910-Pleurochrysis_carterae.AAC.3